VRLAARRRRQPGGADPKDCSSLAAGTAACANGRFYCANAGHEPALLFSSRVNDGVCGAPARSARGSHARRR
jgi:hypothetical protein